MQTETDTEWFVPDTSVEVRQGDLLVARSLQTGKVEEICLVITADCDISKGKFGRQLACLRVLPIDRYVRTNWATKKLDKLKLSERIKLRGQVAKWHTQFLGSESSITADAATDWVMREEPEAICEALQVPEKERKKFNAALSAFRGAIDALDANASRDKLAQFVAYRAAVLRRDIEQSRQEVLADAQKESEALPEDAFLLTSLPQVSEDGAVVLLREIVGIPYEAVCYRVTDAEAETSLLRVGRLHPTFKYAVSQAFGALYSKIGLPPTYEKRCKDVTMSLTSITLE
ncbi:hypothetical protein [Hydrogenophaga taeniospiralis]|uniref:hypothetical protein n=1 Tax=Hydrogenophaga taeniospiralis TaxID=65656 RepID=UPI000B29D55E|nr:hypothetical protein [Hydrogenophaga taeniospiralis]